MTALTVLALLPWMQAQLLAAELTWPKPVSCRVEVRMRSFSLRQHLIDGGSALRTIPPLCTLRKKG